MIKKIRAAAVAATVIAGLATVSPALADGNISCGGGPRAGWADIAALRAQLIAQGWEIKKAKPWRDCYEVYGKTPEGDNVESFFHPVTLQKILVLKRGRELFRAPGY